MASLNQGKIITALEAIVAKGDRDNFIYDFLRAYGTSPATLKRLQIGDRQRNAARIEGDLALVQKIYFRKIPKGQSPQEALKAIQALPVINDSRIRFILVTDFETVLAHDRKVDDTTEFDFAEFPVNYEFFLPLTGLYEKSILYAVHPADIKACEKMGKLYDNIKTLNHYDNSNIHSLNVFLTRLLFCFFAEDTGIFPQKNQMTDAISANTLADGSDLPAFFEKLFAVLDMADNAPSRKSLPASFQAFPYVNGSLFAEKLAIPAMDTKSRKLLIECGQMAWQDISPVIFGSMFQSVMDKEKRRAIGAHYTSEENILKLVRPLFLDDLQQELAHICSMRTGKAKALHDFHAKIASLGFLDPACGCGNFLIVSYRELRELEMQVLLELARTEKKKDGLVFDIKLLTKVSISQFYGIELEEFPVEIARVSLWLMEHVMNMKLGRQFGQVVPSIPLKHTPGIVCANALTTPWENVVPARKLSYILGNPPFSGYQYMTDYQKKLIECIFNNNKYARSLDLVCGWFALASRFITNTKIKVAFVATNSISQGEQVAPLWETIYERKNDIFFGYKTFKWKNEAKSNAGVHCIIVGFSQDNNDKKRLYYSNTSFELVDKITPYMTKGTKYNTIIKQSKKTISASKNMSLVNMPKDGGHLILNSDEAKELSSIHNVLDPYIRPLYGAEEFINGKTRFCLWLIHATPDILELPPVKARLESVRDMRLASKASSTRDYAKYPHLFKQITQFEDTDFLLIPRVSSERRRYIPIGFMQKGSIVTDLVNLVPNATLYDFGILTSTMHMVWMRTVCGRLKSDYRYSRDLCYNTFPWPTVTDRQKAHISTLAEEVLLTRENHPDMTLADLYDPDKMPADLKAAHDALDSAVDSLYRRKPFASDDERLQVLFRMYEILLEKNSPKPITLSLLDYESEE